MKKRTKIIDWIISMIGYALILITISTFFKNTIQIDHASYGLWAFLAAIVIYILNKTIKPILVILTLPITALTLGIFYPFINVIILYITDFVLSTHFDINGIMMAFIVAICISILNMIMDKYILDPIVRGRSI